MKEYTLICRAFQLNELSPKFQQIAFLHWQLAQLATNSPTSYDEFENQAVSNCYLYFGNGELFTPTNGYEFKEVTD